MCGVLAAEFAVETFVLFPDVVEEAELDVVVFLTGRGREIVDGRLRFGFGRRGMNGVSSESMDEERRFNELWGAVIPLLKMFWREDSLIWVKNSSHSEVVDE